MRPQAVLVADEQAVCEAVDSPDEFLERRNGTPAVVDVVQNLADVVHHGGDDRQVVCSVLDCGERPTVDDIERIQNDGTPTGRAHGRRLAEATPARLDRPGCHPVTATSPPPAKPRPP